MLTPDELGKYREALLQRRQDVEEQVSELTVRCEVVAPDSALGRLTRNNAMQDQQMALALRQRLTLQTTQIKTAMDRIESGAFGICVLCREPIDPRRLDLVPESPLCMPCMQKRNASR